MSTKNELLAAMRDLSIAMQDSMKTQQAAMNALVRMNTVVVELAEDKPAPAPQPVEPRQRWMPRQVPPAIVKPSRAKRGAVADAVIELMHRRCGASLDEIREAARANGANGAIGESTIARYCDSRDLEYFIGHRKDGTRAYYVRFETARSLRGAA